VETEAAAAPAVETEAAAAPVEEAAAPAEAETPTEEEKAGE
ncbi:MAG TPA: 50S ribosomal protein L17, partial [Spirochaeta sp.]|nr:50S ribosomal protein L17 [Spirochaeta sp.]